VYGQEIVRLFDTHAVTPTLHETLQHASEKMRDVGNIEKRLDLEGQLSLYAMCEEILMTYTRRGSTRGG